MTPQILYQRPYDPVMIPVQQQQMAMASAPLMALSQPSYAPSRLIPGGQGQGPNMFRHALLRVRISLCTPRVPRELFSPSLDSSRSLRCSCSNISDGRRWNATRSTEPLRWCGLESEVNLACSCSSTRSQPTLEEELPERLSNEC